MADGRDPRHVRLASLLLVAAGVSATLVLPVQYVDSSIALSAFEESLVLLVGGAVGPLLVCWGIWTGWDGTLRSLSPRRLLLAVGLSLGLLLAIQWWGQPSPSGSLRGGATVSHGVDVLPDGGSWSADGPAALVWSLTAAVLGPQLLALLTLAFAVAGTVARVDLRRAAIVGLLAFAPWLLLWFALATSVGLLAFLVFAFALPPAAVRFGSRYAASRAGDSPEPGPEDGTETHSTKPRPAVGVPASPDPADTGFSTGAVPTDRLRRASLAAFTTGFVLFVLFPALHFDPVWAVLGRVDLAVALASSVLAPLLLVWGAASAWRGRVRPLTPGIAVAPVAATPVPAFLYSAHVPSPGSGVDRSFGRGLLNQPVDRMLEFAVTFLDGLPPTALAFVLVGVVLARYGAAHAVASLALPAAVWLAVGTVAATGGWTAWHVGIGLVAAATALVAGYLAADRDATYPQGLAVRRIVRS